MRATLVAAAIGAALLAGCATEAPYTGSYAYGYDYGYYGPGYYSYYDYGPAYYGPSYCGPYLGFTYRGGGDHRWDHRHWSGSDAWHPSAGTARPRSSAVQSRATSRATNAGPRGNSRVAHRASTSVARNDARHDATRGRAEPRHDRIASAPRGPDREHGT